MPNKGGKNGPQCPFCQKVPLVFHQTPVRRGWHLDPDLERCFTKAIQCVTFACPACEAFIMRGEKKYRYEKGALEKSPLYMVEHMEAMEISAELADR